MWGGSPDRNMVSGERGIPASWDVKTKKNIKWVAPLGSQTYGNPVISKGKIFVGTNNNGLLRPGITGDKGVVVCVDEKTGDFLWQATHDKLPTGRVNDWPEQGVCSSPAVVDNVAYYVSNRAEVIAVDTEGFRDGENDGPFKEEENTSEIDGDVLWKLDMYEELAVFPHNMAATSPLVVGDRPSAGLGHGPPGPDRGRLGPEHAATVALDQEGEGERPGVAAALVGLELVELEAGTLGEGPAEVEVEAPEVACDFAELELGAAGGEPDVAGGLAQADAGGDGEEDLGVEVGPVVLVVGSEGLSGEAALAGTAAEARHGAGPAEGLVGALAEEEAALWGAVLRAGGVGAARGLEHGRKPG